MIDCADYVAVNDYEARMLAERTGLSEEEIAERGRGDDRHAWRRRLAHPCRRDSARDTDVEADGAGRSPPVAATRTAPACSTASGKAGTGTAPADSRRCSARSRSRRAAARIMSSTATRWRRLITGTMAIISGDVPLIRRSHRLRRRCGQGDALFVRSQAHVRSVPT